MRPSATLLIDLRRSAGTFVVCGLFTGALIGSVQRIDAAPKVIVISLDGATPRLVNKYLANGAISPNQGIGLLKRKGVHAERNVTVSPSLTAVGHIAIATGSTAAHNDIAANIFHLVASPFTTTISGFGSPIGGYQITGPAITDLPTAEPIWVALRAAGKKVVCATFPGADGLDVVVPGTNGAVVQPSSERTVDYTVPFGESSGVFEKGFTLVATDFGSVPQSTIDQLNQAGVKFYQVKQKTTALDTFFLTGPGGARVNYTIQVAALDTTNSGSFDTLVFFDSTHGIKPKPFLLPSTGPAYVKASDQRSSRFYLEGSPKKSGTGFYVSLLAPDLSSVHIARYSITDLPRMVPTEVLANVDDINNHVGTWGAQPDFFITERLTPVLCPVQRPRIGSDLRRSGGHLE